MAGDFSAAFTRDWRLSWAVLYLLPASHTIMAFSRWIWLPPYSFHRRHTWGFGSMPAHSCATHPGPAMSSIIIQSRTGNALAFATPALLCTASIGSGLWYDMHFPIHLPAWEKATWQIGVLLLSSSYHQDYRHGWTPGSPILMEEPHSTICCNKKLLYICSGGASKFLQGARIISIE